MTTNTKIPKELQRMTPKKLLSPLIKLRDEFLREGPTKEWALAFIWMKPAPGFYKLRPQYERIKPSLDQPIAFLEKTAPFTELDREHVRQATSVKREIHKLLREAKVSKQLNVPAFHAEWTTASSDKRSPASVASARGLVSIWINRAGTWRRRHLAATSCGFQTAPEAAVRPDEVNDRRAVSGLGRGCRSPNQRRKITMAIIKMTEAKLATLQIPEGKARIEWCDVDTPGLYLLATAKGPIRTWFLRYKNQAGKTCHEKIGRTIDVNLAAARARAKQLRAEIALGADPRGEAKAQREVPTLTDFFEGADGYLEHVKSRKRSWKRDEELYRLRIKGVLGGKRLNQITRQQVQVFHTALLDEGLAPATCDHHVKLLRQALNLAVDWQLLDKNPLTRIPLFNADNKVENYLEGDQLETLLAVLRTDENRPVCLLALFLMSTGARLNEAKQATWKQIDKANRVWRIPAPNSKSKRVRSVPLNDSALDVLNRVGSEGKWDYVFVSPGSKGKRNAAGSPYLTIAKVWDRLRKKAGLPHLRLHDLRHQYASFLVNSGRTLYEVQQILGHSNPTVTQRYSHLSSKSLQEAANTASVIINGAMPVAEAQPEASSPTAA